MALFEFGDYSYQEITLKEKLLEVLSYLLRIGDFKQYAGKTILNNVYMDLRGKKPVFKRTKTATGMEYTGTAVEGVFTHAGQIRQAFC